MTIWIGANQISLAIAGAAVAVAIAGQPSVADAVGETPSPWPPLESDPLTVEWLRTAKVLPAWKDGRLLGLQLTEITPEGPWAALGIRDGDQIVFVSGYTIVSPDDASQALRSIAAYHGSLRAVRYAEHRVGLMMSPSEETDLPERVDFRRNPAFVTLRVSDALWMRVEDRALRECPGRLLSAVAGAESQALWQQQQEIEREVHESIKISTGELHAAEFRKRIAEIPRHADLVAKKEQWDRESAEQSRRAEPCVQKIRETEFEEIEFFADPELTKPVARARAFIGVGPRKLRLLPGESWQEFDGDGTPAGEDSHFYETVLEKRGNRLLLPENPFPVPVWFDYEKAYGMPVRTESTFGGISFVFPSALSAPDFHFLSNGKEVVPVSIESGQAVFRIEPEDASSDHGTREERVEEAIRSGATKTVPLESLFDADGHLTLFPAGC